MSFGPVSSAAHGAGSSPLDSLWAFVIVSTPIGLFLLVSFLHRRRALRRLAAQHGWQWIGGAVPRTFPASELLQRAQHEVHISNCFTGAVHGREFLCCDCAVIHGKLRLRTTLVAIRILDDPLSVVLTLGAGFSSSSYKGWICVQATDKKWFSSGARLISANEIEALLDHL